MPPRHHTGFVRAGFVRQLGTGLYSFLPLGWRTVRKLERILREEMEAVGAQEFLLPTLHPAEVWKESGRWDEVDETMFRLRDRRGGDYCLGMTYEEVFAAIARSDLRSYRQSHRRRLSRTGRRHRRMEVARKPKRGSRSSRWACGARGPVILSLL